MQPVNRKNYFLLACLIAIVVIVLAMASQAIFMPSQISKGTTGVAPTSLSYGMSDSVTQRNGANDKMALQSEGGATSTYPIIPPGDTTPVAGTDRKVIKNGNVGVVVKDVDQAAKAIDTKAKELGGYLSATNIITSGNNTKSGYVSARIPVDKVNDFLAYLRSSSVKVTSENINSDDVTSEFIDLQAKIKNSEATAEQYRELLKRAVKVDDVLQVQRELNSIQTQIDSYKGQLKYLEGNSALSNITVNLAIDEGELPIQPENRWEPGNVFKAALRSLTILAQNASYAVIFVAVYAVVWVPILLGLFILYRFLRRKIV